MADIRTYPCALIRVVDGDTQIVTVDHGFYINSRQTLRLKGVNAPEMSTPEGRTVKTAVEQFLAGQTLMLESYEHLDKYGRRLADLILVSDNNMRLTAWLLANNYAVPYMV